MTGRLAGRLVVLLAASVAPFTSPGLAHADDPNAREEAAQFFRAAMAAYDRADFPAAARAFEAANTRAPDLSTVYNAARAWDAAHDDARAAEAYAAAVDGQTLDEASRSVAVRRLAALDRRLAILSVRAPFAATISVDRVHQARAPVVIRLPPGTYDVTIESPDRPPMHRAWVGRVGEHETIDLVPAMMDPRPLALPVPPPTPRATGLNGLEWAGIGALAVAVGAAAVATGLGVDAVAANDDYNAGGHTSAASRAHVVTLQTLTNVAWITAGAGGTAGAIFFGLGVSKQNKQREGATVALSASGVIVRIGW